MIEPTNVRPRWAGRCHRIAERFRRCAAHSLWMFITGPTFPARTIGIFVDGTVAYTLSKIWDDVFAVFVFRLHPLPFCLTDKRLTCKHHADSYTQFLYALFVLIPAGTLKHVSQKSSWIPGIDTIPSMTGMLAGWAFGNAFSQLFAEIRAENSQWLCHPPPYKGAARDCMVLSLGQAWLLTITSALLVTVVRPLTQGVHLGNGPVFQHIEESIESVWQLFSKAAATSVMVVWNETLNRIVLTGVRPSDTIVRSHLYWLWACTATVVGSLLSVLFEKWERHLRARLDQLMRADTAAAVIQMLARRRRKTRRRSQSTPIQSSSAAWAEYSVLSQTQQQRSQPGSKGNPPIFERVTTSERISMNDRTSENERTSNYERTSIYERVSETERTSTYERSPNDRMSAYEHSPKERTSSYERGFSNERLSAYERASPSGRLSTGSPNGRLSAVERGSSYDRLSARGKADADQANGSKQQPGRRLSKRRWMFLNSAIDFCAIVQGTLGWVAGCAWTDVAIDLFPTISMEPAGGVLLSNIGVFVFLMLLSFGFILATGARSDLSVEHRTEREEVEKLFLSGAMSFLSGWAGVLAIRDAVMLSGEVVGDYFNKDPRNEINEDTRFLYYFARLVTVVTISTLLTIVFFVVKQQVRERYNRAIVQRVQRNWLTAAGASKGSAGQLRSFVLRKKLQLVVCQAARAKGLRLSYHEDK